MEQIIAANWKMHKTTAETAAYCRDLRRDEDLFNGVEVLVCPPFTALPAAVKGLEGSPIKLGAQNMHWEAQGAFTGEIGPPMLLDLGVEYVIIGHSERRHLLGEDDGQVNRKMKAALAAGLKPILCVGETEGQREEGATAAVIEGQLAGALQDLDAKKVGRLVVAYEPVWAIGTGKAASPEDAGSAAALIRRFFEQRFGAHAAADLRIQYGGSVKAENIASFAVLPLISGALVGGAGLEAASFSSLVQAARKAVLN